MDAQLPSHPQHAIRLVSRNIDGRTSLMHERIDAIRRLRPDLLALQETTADNLPALRDALPEFELAYVLDSRSLAPRTGKLIGPRKYGELLASRWPIDAFAPSDFDIPRP